MSHFTTLVVVNSASDLTEAIAEAERMLAPFDEDLAVEPYKSYESGPPGEFWAVSSLKEEGLLSESATWEAIATAYNEKYAEDGEHFEVDELGMYSMSTYNPKSKWDWYLLGGRWTGFWPIKVNVEAIVGKPGTMTGPAAPGTADIARKDDIDFGFKVRDKELDAEALFDKFEGVVASVPEDQRGYLPWREVRDAYDIEEARQVYGAQPIVKAYRSDRELPWDDGPEDFFFGQEDARERYVAAARARALTTFAVLDSEGWHEKGSMGWWGMVSNEREQDDWNAAFAQMLDNLAGDAWLAVYDLHI